MFNYKNKPAKKPSIPSTARIRPHPVMLFDNRKWQGLICQTCVTDDETQPAKMEEKEYYSRVIDTMYHPRLGKQFSAYQRVVHTQKYGTILFCRCCPFLDDF